MEKEEGERKNSSKYFYRGFQYHKKSKKNDDTSEFSTFRCVNYDTYGCLGTTKENNESKLVEIIKGHNHEADVNAQKVSKLKNVILKESENTPLKPKNLFNSIVSK